MEAIIFDMDGVIVDTEYIHYHTLRKYLESLGKFIPKEQLSAVVGASSNHFYEMLIEFTGEDSTIAQMEKKLDVVFEKTASTIDYPSIFRKDILSILEYAKRQQMKLAVASSSKMDTIQEVLQSCGIYESFDVIVSGEMFAQSKPHPEIYQYTANTLEIAPEKCIVVEDSSYGIQAAKEAGMTVIGYEETRFCMDQSRADYLEKNMENIYKRIRQLKK